MDEIGMFTALRPEPGAVDVSGPRERLAAEVAGPARRMSRRTRFALAGGLVATAVATAIVVPVTLPGGEGGARAWAVDRNQDGTVTVTLGQEFSDPAGLERALRADGITAYVQISTMLEKPLGKSILVYPSCAFKIANKTISTQVVVSEHFPRGNSLGSWSWTLRPSAMPKGSALLLFAAAAAGTKDIVAIGEPEVIRISKPPVCVPQNPTPPVTP